MKKCEIKNTKSNFIILMVLFLKPILQAPFASSFSIYNQLNLIISFSTLKYVLLHFVLPVLSPVLYYGIMYNL